MEIYHAIAAIFVLFYKQYILFIIGLFLVLKGLAFMKFIIQLKGFVFGAFLGAAIAFSMGEFENFWIFSIIVSLLGAYLAWPLHKFFIVLLYGILFAIIGLLVTSEGIVALLFFIIGIGVSAYYFEFLYICYTSAWGALIITYSFVLTEFSIFNQGKSLDFELLFSENLIDFAKGYSYHLLLIFSIFTFYGYVYQSISTNVRNKLTQYFKGVQYFNTPFVLMAFFSFFLYGFYNLLEPFVFIYGGMFYKYFYSILDGDTGVRLQAYQPMLYGFSLYHWPITMIATFTFVDKYYQLLYNKLKKTTTLNHNYIKIIIIYLFVVIAYPLIELAILFLNIGNSYYNNYSDMIRTLFMMNALFDTDVFNHNYLILIKNLATYFVFTPIVVMLMYERYIKKREKYIC